jgi:hypothetical protein
MSLTSPIDFLLESTLHLSFPSLSLFLGSSILKGSDDGVMHFEKSCFRTLSIVQCFFFNNNVSENGSASVFRKKGGGPQSRCHTFPPFYLKAEAQPVSKTLFLKKKHWTMDKVLNQDSSKLFRRVSASKV